MGKLLLITGDLATGKSTFAGKLSRRWDVSVFYKDRFKETLGETIGFSNREQNLRLSVASAALMRMVFEEFCKLNKNLILESNFRQAELEQLHKMAGDWGFDVLTVVCRGEDKLLHDRFLHRLHHEDRHPVHASGGFEQFDNFSRYICQQRDIEIPGSTILVDANDFAYQQDSWLLQKLDSFMGVLDRSDIMIL